MTAHSRRMLSSASTNSHKRGEMIIRQNKCERMWRARGKS